MPRAPHTRQQAARLRALAAASLLAAAALVGCGGGGGGGGGGNNPIPLPPLVLASDPTLSGAGTATIRVRVPVDALGQSPRIPYRTQDLGSGTGFAVGGASCTAGVDYVTTSGTLTPTAQDTTLAITLCANSSVEPNERFEVLFDWVTGVQRAEVLVINDAAGGLNDTGASQCLDSAGALVACSATTLAGQDATAGRDALALTNGGSDGRLGFSFSLVTAMGGGCLADRVTGLTWNTAGTANTLADAQAAVAAANASTRCGIANWRLPTAAELASIVDNGAAAAPRIDAQFTATPVAAFWSAEAYVGDTRANWVVDFASGAVAFETATNPLAKPAAVRAVSGSSAAAPACTDANPARYVDSGNGTVTDTATGLMWMQCSEGQSGAACAGGSATVYRSFGEALARAQAVNADRNGLGRGFGDWRLPNRNELASLVNRSCERPAIQRTRFPATPSLSAWSSTPVRAGLVWYVDFSDGTVAPGGSSGDRVVRLVRAGQ